MTQYEYSNLIIQVIGFLLVSISIFYYARQAKSTGIQAEATKKQVNLLTSSLEMSTYIDFETSLFELSKLIIQNPSVRPYLYDKLELPAKNHQDYNLVVSFCVFYLDFFDHVLTMQKLSPASTTWAKMKWEKWILDMFICSPALLQIFEEERHWYIEDLGKIADSVKQRISQ